MAAVVAVQRQQHHQQHRQQQLQQQWGGWRGAEGWGSPSAVDEQPSKRGNAHVWHAIPEHISSTLLPRQHDNKNEQQQLMLGRCLLAASEISVILLTSPLPSY